MNLAQRQENLNTEITRKILANEEILELNNCKYIFISIYNKFSSVLQYTLLEKDDIMQLCAQGYIKAVLGYDSNRHQAKFTSYLYKACYNLVYNEVNTHKRGVKIPERQFRGVKDSEFSTEQVVYFSDVEAVKDERDFLTTEETYLQEYLSLTSHDPLAQKIIHLKSNGLSSKEVAEVLGVSPVFICRRLAIVRKQLEKARETHEVVCSQQGKR